MTASWITVLSLPIVCLLPPVDLHGEPQERSALQMETVRIQGARFVMGTPIREGEPEYHADEAPRTVAVRDFRIGKFPVTARQMCLFLNSKQAGSYNRDRLYNHRNIGTYTYSTIDLVDGRYVPRDGAVDAPANQVTWLGAVVFCRWLSDETAKTFRLPSEAEWELAARGPEERKWPWGNDDPTAKHGLRYDDTRDRVALLTWPRVSVGSYPANATPQGVHDMLAYIIGEWCANKYIKHPRPEQLTDTAVDEDNERTPRVVRGYFHRYYPRGGFLLTMSHLGRPWTRVKCDPVNAPRRAARHGFRVVEENETGQRR